MQIGDMDKRLLFFFNLSWRGPQDVSRNPFSETPSPHHQPSAWRFPPPWMPGVILENLGGLGEYSNSAVISGKRAELSID